MDSEFESERPERPEAQVAVPPQIDPVPELPPAKPRTAMLIVGAVLVVLLLAGGVTLLKRAHDERVLAKETERNSVPSVAVIHPMAEKPDQELVLPGSCRPMKNHRSMPAPTVIWCAGTRTWAAASSRASCWPKSIPPRSTRNCCKCGPRGNRSRRNLTWPRPPTSAGRTLRQTDSVSQQEADQQSSIYQQSKANLAAADANVRRLEQLESFKNVYAPFSGVLTKRNVDPGALINAGAGGRELFDIAKVDPLRVYVNVPQAYAPNIKIGMKAWVTLQEFPGQKFQGSGGAHRGSHRYGDPHAADRNGRAQQRRTSVAGLVWSRCISPSIVTRIRLPSRSMPCCFAPRERGWPWWEPMERCNCGRFPLAAIMARRWRSWTA